jgi:ATP/maltotriose-dependent transcriptional regulator MalT
VLVAPAGYGKTTLGRQWMDASDRVGAWYQAGPGSSDVAALVAGIADAIGGIVSAAPDDIHQRLKATVDPEVDASALGAMLTRHVEEWPQRAWLVIDDYHYIAQSPVAEALVDKLTQSARLNLLIAARQRPNWVTPRKLIYRDVFEINRSTLALTPDEAANVVGEERSRSAAGLIALAEGWPAVIGLAAHVDELDFEDGVALPKNLYDFFAEELFQATPSALRGDLFRLALIGSALSRQTVSQSPLVPQQDSLHALEALGFVSSDGISIAMHPLLRAFLFGKLKSESPERTGEALSAALHHLLALKRWDDAFELVETFDADDWMPQLVEQGVYELLAAGRVPTVERWVRRLRAHKPGDALVDLLDGEILFRRGHWSEAERLGERAASKFGIGHVLRSRAFFRAGQCAQFGDRLVDAIRHHNNALSTASTSGDKSQALWGLFIAQSELELIDDALRSLRDFEQTRTGSIEDELRLISSSMTRWVRERGVGKARELEKRAKRFLDQPADPVVRCGLYQMLSIAYGLGGDYRRALRAAERELGEARHNFLSFVVPHALTNHASAYLGLRMMRNAESSIDAAEQSAIDQDDVHSQLNACAIRARLLLALGRPQEAVEACGVTLQRHPNPGMLSDFLSSKALALACLGEGEEALSVARDATATSRLIETRVQCAAVHAIVALTNREEHASSRVEALIDEVESTGNVDGLIAAYRGFPPLLLALAACDYSRLDEVLRLARDTALARRVGLSKSENRRPNGLTRRELEVHELLKDGRTNREIARALWISEPTVKLHVHHILEKLGARSRTEAALKTLSDNS